ncbi:cupin-like domain-containing protein [Sphingomonas sp.]|uniref:cupin-like domain-containing protein n=1 Tax=Sphingomonas sp. TaxID=28214 RepID=UPI003B3A573A
MPSIVEYAAAQIDAETFRRDIVAPCRPVVLRGLVREWPVVKAATVSTSAFGEYLARFVTDRTMEAFIGSADVAGRYFYSEDLNGFNFERRAMTLRAALDHILSEPVTGQTVYAGSLSVAEFLPGFAAENALSLLDGTAAPRIWLGHASRVATHYDAFDNLACVILGRRRFTLYPPEAIADLYVGPIDHTMAGQPVSLAASAAPDDPRFPRFAQIRDQALTAELEAGDALYLPKLWWHQIEATAPANGLINYWWDAFSSGPDAPHTSMLLAMIAIAERPQPEREAWRAFFDHYVFRSAGHPLAHLPPEQHGILGPLKANYGRIRAYVLQMLRG